MSVATGLHGGVGETAVREDLCCSVTHTAGERATVEVKQRLLHVVEVPYLLVLCLGEEEVSTNATRAPL